MLPWVFIPLLLPLPSSTVPDHTVISSLFLEGWKNLNGMGAANFPEHPGSYGFLQEFLYSWGQSHWASAQGLPGFFLQRMGPLGGSDSGQSRKRLCSTIHRGGEGKARVFTCLKWGHSPSAVWLPLPHSSNCFHFACSRVPNPGLILSSLNWHLCSIWHYLYRILWILRDSFLGMLVL